MRRAIVAGLFVTVLAAGCGSSPKPTPPPVHRLDVRQVLSRAPYMGVSCPRANSIACDRVGLAIGLRKPARSVIAVVGGRRFALDDGELRGSPKPHGIRRAFAGFLQPAGLRNGPLRVQVENGRNRWTGVKPVNARVRLLVTYANGTEATTSLTVPLMAGWG